MEPVASFKFKYLKKKNVIYMINVMFNLFMFPPIYLLFFYTYPVLMSTSNIPINFNEVVESFSANVLFTAPHQYSAQQTLMPLVSLAKWSILSPILSNEKELFTQHLEDYSRLHSGIVECLNDVLERRYVK